MKDSPTFWQPLLASVALWTAGCSWEPLEAERPVPVVISQPSPVASETPVDVRRRGDAAATMAEKMIGTPYLWGGSDLEGFDCSGLVHFSYAQTKLDVPRTTAQLRRFSRNIQRSQLRRGDLVFFDIKGKDNHVGVYLGDGLFVHAPARGKRVETASMNEGYFATVYAGAGRIPGADLATH